MDEGNGYLDMLRQLTGATLIEQVNNITCLVDWLSDRFMQVGEGWEVDR